MYENLKMRLKVGGKKMLALALYEDKGDVYPEEFVILEEGDYQKAIF